MAVKACVRLSKTGNAECGTACRPRRACPEAHSCGVALLARATAIAYMDVGEEREQGAEALPAKRVLHLYASDHAEAICN